MDRLALRFIRLLDGWRSASCEHVYESHDSKDEPGVTVYLCPRCGHGWKVT